MEAGSLDGDSAACSLEAGWGWQLGCCLDGDSAACSLEAALECRFSSISMDLEDLVSQD